MTKPIRTYGWIPDNPDHRDHIFAAARTEQPMPPKVDLHAQCPPLYDQGQLGSCTANAIAGAVDFERNRQKMPFLTPSRLFIYYNERDIEGTADQDSGAMLRDGIKAVASKGVCAESVWPYRIKEFATKPPAAAYAAAQHERAIDYTRIAQDLPSMKGCLAQGYPFVFGFTVFESFESNAVAHTGKVPLPSSSEQQLGGHAVLAVGYSDLSQRFLVRNSWGSSWGIHGYFTIPYAYLTDPDLASDFWMIRLVS
jgi:C1A family cysteine protease